MRLLRTLAIAAAVAALALPSAAQETRFINMATGNSGGTWYPAGIALAKLLSDETGIRTSAISSAGSVENVSLLRNAEVNMGFMQIDVAQNAILGRGPFEGNKFDGMVMLSPLFSSVDHILVANDSGIDGLTGIKGKRMAVGRPGSGTLISTTGILGAVGVTLEDINAEYLGQAEAIGALQNGIIDATLVSAGIPATSVTEAVTVAGDKFTLYNMTDEERSMVLKSMTWKIPFTVPAGTYPEQEAAIETTAHMGVLMVPEDFPKSTATAILETMYGNLDKLGGVHAIYKSVSLERNADAFEALDVKKHPAAEAFFGQSN